MEEKPQTSAVLDVVTENKILPSSCKALKEQDLSSNSVENSTNSLLQSPSVESLSTLADVEALSELNMDENSDLCVKVDNPQKHPDTLETVVTFRITTKVARIEFEDNEYVVRRRYNEFVWLRNKLVDNHPFCIVPPLPGKHGLIEQLDRYSKDFILNRMRLLNTFMARIARHPILSCSEHFKLFVAANHSDFIQYRKYCATLSRPQRPNQHSRPTKSSRNAEFEKAQDYLVAISDELSSLEKISTRINKVRQELAGQLQAYFPLFHGWSQSDPELAPVLQHISGAIEKMASAQTALTSNYHSTVADPIKEFLMYIDVVRTTLSRRQACQSVYEGSAEELAKVRAEKDQIIAAQGSAATAQNSSRFSFWLLQPSCDDKLEKIGTRIPQLVRKVESNQDSLECANECLRSDLQRWQKEKQQCVNRILVGFVNQQIAFHEQYAAAWESVVSELAAPQDAGKK